MRTITMDEVKQAVQEVNGGWHYIADRPISGKDGDWYLRVVYAWRTWESGKDEYVTWLYNASLRGLHAGRYTFNKDIAREDFHERN